MHYYSIIFINSICNKRKHNFHAVRRYSGFNWILVCQIKNCSSRLSFAYLLIVRVHYAVFNIPYLGWLRILMSSFIGIAR